MRVLHVIDGIDAGGGAEESLVGMLPLLRERGIEGVVACLYDRGAMWTMSAETDSAWRCLKPRPCSTGRGRSGA